MSRIFNIIKSFASFDIDDKRFDLEGNPLCQAYINYGESLCPNKAVNIKYDIENILPRFVSKYLCCFFCERHSRQFLELMRQIGYVEMFKVISKLALLQTFGITPEMYTLQEEGTKFSMDENKYDGKKKKSKKKKNSKKKKQRKCLYK